MRRKDKVHQKFLLTKKLTNEYDSSPTYYCVLQKFNEHDHLKTQEALKLSFRASSLA